MPNPKATFTAVVLNAEIIQFQTRQRSKEIWDAVEQLALQAGALHAPTEKFLVTFSRSVILRTAKNRMTSVRQAQVRLFMTPAATLTHLCYTFNRRKGYMFHDGDLLAIESVELVDPAQPVPDRIAKVQKLARCIHPNAWDDFKQELQSSMAQERYARRGLSPVDIRKLLPASIILEVEEAFKNKTKFHYRHCGKRRNWIVEVSPGDDGVLRAWFNSYHKEAAHGSEYLLLNPHTAAFMERD
jgi:hypothetical protein